MFKKKNSIRLPEWVFLLLLFPFYKQKPELQLNQVKCQLSYIVELDNISKEIGLKVNTVHHKQKVKRAWNFMHQTTDPKMLRGYE